MSERPAAFSATGDRDTLSTLLPTPIDIWWHDLAEVDLPGVRFLHKPVNCEHLLDIIAATLVASGRSAPGGALDEGTGSAPFMA